VSRPTWFVGALKRAYPLLLRLAVLTRVPGLRGLADRLFFEGDDILYLPRDSVIHVGQQVEAEPSVPLPSWVAEELVERATHHWIMRFCVCRAANGCKSYPIDLGCLFLGEGVLGINPELGRLVTKEEALAHLARCRQAGLVHMVGRVKLDTLWLGTNPRERLITICNCCPCCCLWRMLPQLDPSIAGRVTRMPGVQVRVTGRCVGCGTCAQGVCFVDAIHMNGRQAVISDACRGCGRCVEACPAHAIELTFDPEVSFEQTAARLGSLVGGGAHTVRPLG